MGAGSLPRVLHAPKISAISGRSRHFDVMRIWLPISTFQPISWRASQPLMHKLRDRGHIPTARFGAVDVRL